MKFANKIAEIAKQGAHHPDLTISWGVCSVEIWTHKINGFTENDFILAAVNSGRKMIHNFNIYCLKIDTV